MHPIPKLIYFVNEFTKFPEFHKFSFSFLLMPKFSLISTTKYSEHTIFLSDITEVLIHYNNFTVPQHAKIWPHWCSSFVEKAALNSSHFASPPTSLLLLLNQILEHHATETHLHNFTVWVILDCKMALIKHQKINIWQG